MITPRIVIDMASANAVHHEIYGIPSSLAFGIHYSLSDMDVKLDSKIDHVLVTEGSGAIHECAPSQVSRTSAPGL